MACPLCQPADPGVSRLSPLLGAPRAPDGLCPAEEDSPAGDFHHFPSFFLCFLCSPVQPGKVSVVFVSQCVTCHCHCHLGTGSLRWREEICLVFGHSSAKISF